MGKLLARGWAGLVVIVSMSHPAVLASSNEFPEPPALATAVDFWERVYVQVSTDQGLLHDTRHMGVVYEVLDLDADLRAGEKKKRLERRRRHWRGRLEHLAAGGAPGGEVERDIVAAFRDGLGRAPTRDDYLAARKRIRFQRGLREKFKAGLERAGTYEPYIRRVLRRRGLPEALAYLPHVESSYVTSAFSKYGASGLWQFMPATGRRYLEVSYVRDDRLDPYMSSVAAASLLAENYAKLGSWPLAITAYNHGAAGVARAVRKLGTHDLGVMYERYQSRTFKFASRNFYAQFLAAQRVASAPQKHFGVIRRHAPRRYLTVTLPFYVDARQVSRHWGIPVERLRSFNPALRPVVWSSDKRIPVGFELKVPEDAAIGGAESLLAAIPVAQRHSEQVRSRIHVVARGETLGKIARRHGTSVRALMSLNSLSNANRIYPGQKLELLSAKPAETPSADTLVQAPTREPVVATASAAAVEPKTKPAAHAADTGNQASAQTVSDIPPSRLSSASWGAIETGYVVVDSGETLGHYADWLDLPIRRLRELNDLRRSRPIRVGQRLQLEFTRVSAEGLVAKRLAHHRALEKRFLARHRITGTRQHTVRAGDSLWALSRKTYDVPPWLIHRYNPDTDLSKLTPGMRFTVPLVERIPS